MQHILAPLVALMLVQPSESPTLKVKLESSKPSTVFKGTVQVSFPSGFHGYQNPPTLDYQIPVKLEAVEKTVKLAKVVYPKGVDFQMEGEASPSKVYQGTVSIPFEVHATGKALPKQFTLKLQYQLCNDTTCFPPGAILANVKLAVPATPGKKS